VGLLWLAAPAPGCQVHPGRTSCSGVVAWASHSQGSCTLTIDHVAALAGVSGTTVRKAVREARLLGLLKVEERRLSAWRNLPNRVTILSPEWLAWLKLRARGVGKVWRRLGCGHGALPLFRKLPVCNVGL